MGEPVDLEVTGERHIPAYEGQSWASARANIDHMLRYALVAPFVQGQKVLDISCGSGYGSQYLALQGAKEVIGVDSAEESIQFAAQYYSHPKVTYQVADAHALTAFQDEAFDVIVSFETIEHLQNPRIFLTELRRLLKTDGQIFISCPNDYRLVPPNWISPYHLHRFRFHEFRDLFVHIFGQGFFLGQHYMVASWIVNPMAPPSRSVHQAAYLEPLSAHWVKQHYLEDISSVEQADGYLAIYGVNESEIEPQMALSQNAHHCLIDQIMRDDIARRTMLQEISSLQDRLQVSLSTDALHQQALTQEVEHLRRKIAAMETSKFWKLRQLWFSLKKLVGLQAE